MDIKEINTKLQIYGEKLETNDYFVVLAQKLASQYENYFDYYRIKRLLPSNFLLAHSRLDLKQLSFDQKEISYLEYDEIMRICFSPQLVLTFDLQGEIIELLLKGQKVDCKYLTLKQAIDVIEQFDPSVDMMSFSHFLEMIYLKSLIYQAAFLELKAKMKSKISVARAGMFQNAYYHLIEQKLTLSSVFPAVKAEKAIIRA